MFRVSNKARNSVHLSNFSAKKAGYCGYSQVFNSRGIKEASGEVIVLKSNEIKECKWVSFNGTFAQLPGQFFLAQQLLFEMARSDLTNIHL